MYVCFLWYHVIEVDEKKYQKMNSSFHKMSSLKLIDYYAQRIINLEINYKLSELELIKEEIINFDQDIRDAIEEEVLAYFDKDISELSTINLIFCIFMPA